MKNKDFIKLVETALNNIIIRDLNICSYVSKIRLNDCLNFYKIYSNEKNIKECKYYFNRIKELLKDFNLKLNLNFKDIKDV